jgi:hypothetical protein
MAIKLQIWLGFFGRCVLRDTSLERSLIMPRKRFSAEQIVTVPRQIEVAIVSIFRLFFRATRCFDLVTTWQSR